MATAMIFAGVTFFFATMEDSAGNPAVPLSMAAFLGALFAFTYWGWKFLTNHFPILWGGTGVIWLIYVVLKFIVAYFIGLIVGPLQILRMLYQIRVANRIKHQIARRQL